MADTLQRFKFLPDDTSLGNEVIGRHLSNNHSDMAKRLVDNLNSFTDP